MKSYGKKIWFPAKRYGWGWGPPCSWEGWVVLLAYIALNTGGAFLLMPEHPVLWGGEIIALGAALIAICWFKGERPRWRWGGK